MDGTHTSLRHKNWGAWGGGNKSTVQLCEGRHRRCSGPPLPFSPTRRGVPLVSRDCALHAAPGSHPPTPRPPSSPMMMVQALTSPISFLSVTRSEAPGPGPGPGEGEGAGPGCPRPLGCCVWPAMSLSRRFPAPCTARSVPPAASPSVRPSVRLRAALAARTALTGGRMRWRGARAVGPKRLGPGRGGRRAGRLPLPPPSLKGTPPAPLPSPGRGR